MRNNAGYAQSRLRAARVYEPMAILPSELEPGRRNALPQEAGCYDAYRQIIAADCAAHVGKKSGVRQKSSPFGE
jgi:hypothetical protein